MLRLTETFYRGRIAAIQEQIAEQRLAGVLILDAANVMYVCGFFHIPSERPIGLFVPPLSEPILYVPLLEKENAADTWIGDIRTYFEYPGEEHPVMWMIRDARATFNSAGDIALDSAAHDVFVRLGDSVTMTRMINQMRWVKTPEELALIEKAAEYADFCLQYLLDHAADILRDGGTELDLLRACVGATAEKMEREVGAVFKLGGRSVVGTVHSGPRAALPHGSPIARRPQPGEPIIAGIGAAVGGYHAESGATFVYGEPSADVMRCLQAAAACSDATIQALKPGATCSSVNRAALNVLHDAGFGHAVRHRIGHGMGIEGHESPWLAPGDETILAPNMVFSNEPGIYRPGQDGYRTINTMIVTEGAARVPSRFLTLHPPEKRIIAL